jgi:splicing factor 3B subunit 3
MKLIQLSADAFVSVAFLRTAFCSGGGYVSVSTNDMVFFTLEESGIESGLDVNSSELEMTPRQIVAIPNSTRVCVLCSDMIAQIWKSHFRFFDSTDGSLSDPVWLDEGFAVTSAAHIDFSNDPHIVVGLSKNLRFNPRACDGGRLLLINPDSGEISRVTDVEDIPGAIGPFLDGVLCGIGRVLRVYRLGVHRLLKRSECRAIPFFIAFADSRRHRIVIGDSAESFHFLKFDPGNEIITPFCDDATPRFPLSAIILDRATVCCGDRFGNLTVLRVPLDVSDDAEVDPSGVGMIWEHSNMCGSPNKLTIAASFHIGDPITSLSFSPSHTLIYWATVSGAVGTLVPFRNDTDLRLCRRLESCMRQSLPPLCGRVHELYRSYYAPLKNVIDGDLLLRFFDLPDSDQHKIADSLSSTPFDIGKLLNFFESHL